MNTDELLKLIEKAEKERENLPKLEEKSKVNWTVRKFVRELGLKPGPDKVPNYVLYYYYRVKWKGVHPPDKVNKIVFFRSLAQYLPRYRSNNVRQYLLDNDGKFDVSKVGKLEAKQYDKKAEKIRKTCKQKRESKKSKSKKRSESQG